MTVFQLYSIQVANLLLLISFPDKCSALHRFDNVWFCDWVAFRSCGGRGRC